MSRLPNILLHTIAPAALASCLLSPAYAVTTDVLLPPETHAATPAPVPQDTTTNIAPSPTPDVLPGMAPPAAAPEKPSALSSIMSFFNKPAGTGKTAAPTTPGIAPPGSTTQQIAAQPTHVFTIPTPPTAPSVSAMSRGSNSLTITMPETPWTNFSATMVGSHLGLTADEALRKCVPVYNGHIISDKGIYNFQASGTTKASYDGSVNMLLVAVLASCDIKTLPSNAGLVIQEGNRYEVPLNSMSCQVPKKAISTVQFTMDGYGVATCSYQ